MEMLTKVKIVSGAQTGVDRAALDVALECGAEAGGWCPQGRLSEDGVVPERYPVIELPGSGYRQRTRQNVIDSDGTVVIYYGTATGGTRQTIDFCMSERRPCALIDAQAVAVEQASKKIALFIHRHSVTILNVAGPRASAEPRAYEYAKQVIKRVLQRSI